MLVFDSVHAIPLKYTPAMYGDFSRLNESEIESVTIFLMELPDIRYLAWDDHINMTKSSVDGEVDECIECTVYQIIGDFTEEDC